jgi:hypothetical protein
MLATKGAKNAKLAKSERDLFVFFVVQAGAPISAQHP